MASKELLYDAKSSKKLIQIEKRRRMNKKLRDKGFCIVVLGQLVSQLFTFLFQIQRFSSDQIQPSSKSCSVLLILNS